MDENDNLAEHSCEPCKAQTRPLHGEKLQHLQQEVGDWDVVAEHHLEKTYDFDDFKQALDFVNRVGRLAQQEDHHPNVHLSYGKVKLLLWTHAIGGLSENDFILAAKIDRLPHAA